MQRLGTGVFGTLGLLGLLWVSRFTSPRLLGIGPRLLGAGVFETLGLLELL